jgi:mannose-6-phosphate isomerase-like protein (cupin superfamily)
LRVTASGNKAREEDDVNAGPNDESGRIREKSGAALVVDKADLAASENVYEFEGHRHDANVSFIVIDGSPPGSGPKLHKHPYEEVFVVQEGDVTFTVGEDEIEASGGQVVVVPAGVPHKFVNSGTGPLRQIDIHPTGRFVTGWLKD